jgi:hypothetical protein
MSDIRLHIKVVIKVMRCCEKTLTSERFMTSVEMPQSELIHIVCMNAYHSMCIGIVGIHVDLYCMHV